MYKYLLILVMFFILPGLSSAQTMDNSNAPEAIEQGREDTVYSELQKTEALFNAGKNQEVMNLCLTILEKDSKAREAYNRMGQVFERVGDYQRAENNYIKFLDLSREAENTNDKATALNNLAIIYSKQGNFIDAIDFMSQCITFEENIGIKARLAKRYNNLGGIYQENGNFLKALKLYSKSLEVYTETKDSQGTAMVLNNLGTLFVSFGQLDKAKEYYDRCLESLDNENVADVAKVYNNIGSYFKAKTAYEKALDSYNKSLTLEQKLGNQPNIAKVYNNIGTVYYSKGNYNTALEYLNKAVKIDQKLNLEKPLAIDYSNIALVYREMKKYDHALRYFEEANNTFEKYKQYHLLGGNHNNIGLTYRLKGNYDLALSHYKKSIGYYVKSQDKKSEAAVWTNVAELYYNNKKDYKKAFLAYEKANQLAIELKDLVGLGYSFWWMGYMKEKEGDYFQARDFYEKSHASYRLANRSEANVLKHFILKVNAKLVLALKQKGDMDGARDAQYRYGRMDNPNFDGIPQGYDPFDLTEQTVDYKGGLDFGQNRKTPKDDVRVEEEVILHMSEERY